MDTARAWTSVELLIDMLQNPGLEHRLEGNIKRLNGPGEWPDALFVQPLAKHQRYWKNSASQSIIRNQDLDSMLELTEINIYPVKSTRRISLGESTVLKRGLAWDRRWMLVDSDGNFITARKYPRLATVSTQLTPDTLNVSVRGMPELCIPLEPPKDGETRQVTVWRDTCTAIEYGLDYDQWFSEFLGLGCHLVRMRSSDVRAVSADYGMEGDEVSFADSFPLLLISEASLADLNNRLDNPVSMRRFRPNIVVSGCDAFDEDHWRRLRIGNVEFEGARACSRCVFTTIDPDTGEKDADREPLRTLGTYRKRKEGGIFFGQNLIPRGAGTIHVGDPVTIETRTGQAG